MKLNILFVLLCANIIYSQGNYNIENFGNKSLLLGGNVTGSVDDLGLMYYNPARIALVENPVFSISAKGYQLNSVDVNNPFNNDNKANNARFNGIPSMFAGTFKIKSLENHFFSYGFLSKERSDLEIGYSTEIDIDDIIENDSDLESLVGDASLRNRVSDEWFGVSWGKELAPNFSLGVSSFFSIYSDDVKSELKYAGLFTNENVALYNNDLYMNQFSLGMFWKVGLAWELNNIDLGLNFDLPYLEFIGVGQINHQEYSSNFGNDMDIFDYTELEDLNATRKVPLGINFGAGIKLKKAKLHLKVDYHSNVDSYEFIEIPDPDNSLGDYNTVFLTEDLNPVFNFGIGAEFNLSQKFNLYTSFSTDYSPYPAQSNLYNSNENKSNDLHLDYYHYALGFDLRFESVHIIFGTTYSTGTANFDQQLEIPDASELNYTTSLSITRLRFIIGLEIPVLGKSTGTDKID